MKIALIDSTSLRPWYRSGHRLAYLAQSFLTGGRAETVLIDAAELPAPLPIIAGAQRERDIRPLIEATRLVAAVRDHDPDLCVVPLRGGLAHGLLMARACGELSADMRIALVAEERSRTFLETASWHLQPLVADAMERFSLMQADALLTAQDDPFIDTGEPASEPLPAIACLSMEATSYLLAATCEEPREIFFVGPFNRANGIVAFIDAVEKLIASPLTPFRRVTFCGPVEDVGQMVGREWLGWRAQAWTFAFRMVETDDFVSAVHLALRSPCIVLLAGLSPDMVATVGDRFRLSARLSRREIEDPTALSNAIEAACRAQYRRSAVPWTATADVARLEHVALRKCHTGQVGKAFFSICILHHERPRLLRQAIESFRRQSKASRLRCELIIFDNGSQSIESRETLEEIDADASLSVVYHAPALHHTSAMNAMASHASGSYLVFLDDDNLLCDNGLEILIKACDADAFDVVTNNVYVFDTSEAAIPSPTALMAFIGPAYTAGLFFNAFGDTCMAISRQAFVSLGGFLDSAAPSPAPDWLLLARAQAAGLRIGVLQEPAFLYRRDTERADRSALKYDQHGLRRLILANYGHNFDVALIGSLAQTLFVATI